MSVEISLIDLLDRGPEAYKAIDIRGVEAKAADAIWPAGEPALMVIRFSYEDVHDVRGKQQQLYTRWGRVETDNFRIWFSAMKFEGLRSLVDIDLGQALPSLTLRRGTTYLREKSEWPCFEGVSGEHSPVLYSAELEREVRAKFPLGVYEAISALLEIDFRPQISLDLAVGVPFYARIENLDFGEQRCKISVKFHRNMSDLALDIAVREREPHHGAVKESHRVEIDITESRTLDDYLSLWEKEIELPLAAAEDYITASLRHTKPYALDVDEDSEQVGWPFKAKMPGGNLLWDAFCRFCDKETFEAYLTSPHECRHAQDTFERAISWLLGIYGFETIWLGRTPLEQIRARATRVELGASTDILACYGKDSSLLFLFECTINPYRDEDINKLINLRRILLGEVFKDTRVQINPYIFSGAAELGVKEKGGVKVLDANDIRDLLNLATQGKTNIALFKYFGIRGSSE